MIESCFVIRKEFLVPWLLQAYCFSLYNILILWFAVQVLNFLCVQSHTYFKKEEALGAFWFLFGYGSFTHVPLLLLSFSRRTINRIVLQSSNWWWILRSNNLRNLITKQLLASCWWWESWSLWCLILLCICIPSLPSRQYHKICWIKLVLVNCKMICDWSVLDVILL